MTNAEFRAGLLRLGFDMRAHGSRLDTAQHNAFGDVTRRHVERLDRLVNEWTPDAPAVVEVPGDVLEDLTSIAETCRLEAGHVEDGRAAQHGTVRALLCAARCLEGLVAKRLRAALAAPGVPEAGKPYRERTSGRPVRLVRIDAVWAYTDQGPRQPLYSSIDSFLERFEPVPTPPEPPEPEVPEQLWHITQRQAGYGELVLYRNRHSGDCDNRWGRKDDAKAFPLTEAATIIADEVARKGSRAVYLYGIEPTGEREEVTP